MSEPTRLLAVRELIGKGWLTMVQPREYRVIDGRSRAVAGHTQYTLHRHPVKPENIKKAEKSSKLKVDSALQNSTSSCPVEVGQEVFQNISSCAVPDSVSVRSLKVSGEENNHRHQSTTKYKTDDDDCSLPVSESSKPKDYQERLAQFKADAKAAILHNDAKVHGCQLRDGDKPIPQVVDKFLADVIVRAHYADTVISSSNYLVSAFQNFMESGAVIEKNDKDISLPLRRWMDVRILTRAHRPVRSASAYLQPSRPEFLKHLAVEIETYLMEEATNVLRARPKKSPTVSTDDVLDEDPFDLCCRVCDAATEILGIVYSDKGQRATLREKPEQVAGPRGPSERYAHLWSTGPRNKTDILLRFSDLRKVNAVTTTAKG